MYVRALRQVGQYAATSDEFVQLAKEKGERANGIIMLRRRCYRRGTQARWKASLSTMFGPEEAICLSHSKRGCWRLIGKYSQLIYRQSALTGHGKLPANSPVSSSMSGNVERSGAILLIIFASTDLNARENRPTTPCIGWPTYRMSSSFSNGFIPICMAALLYRLIWAQCMPSR